MKKADLYKKINRNKSNIFNHVNLQSPRNVSSPDVYTDTIRFNDDITTGVQIIELNSSDNPQTSSDDNEQNYVSNMTHAWNRVYNDRFDDNQNNNEANRNARERRRTQNRSNYSTGDYTNAAYSYYGESNDIKENVVFNNQMNCFTIFDNHYLVNPDSSSDEEYAKFEEMQCDNTVHDWNDEEIVTYEPELDMEKRTVWIYSYKNKRLLSDDEFELINIPSRDASSTSSSLAEIEGPVSKHNGVSRVATPIPSLYVPKLILPLTPTLPIVTEVTEPSRKSSSNQTDKQSAENVVIKQKPVNNWLSENVTLNSGSKKLEKSFSVVDWMALSPREKRRRFRNASPIIIKLPTVNEVSENAEVKSQTCSLESIRGSQRAVTEINATVEAGHSSARTNQSNEPTSRDSDDECTPEDRGDYNKTKRYPYTPQIRFSPKPVSIFSVITEPIETREEGDGWVVKRRTRRRRYHDDEGEDVGTRGSGVRGDCAGDTLLIRNMSLLRPAHWAEYLPLSASRPSLPLSCNTESEGEPRSWLTRIARCFRCCK